MDSIYREQLMEHYKDPQNRGQLADADITIAEINPFCGDNITLQLKIVEEIIEKVAFDGSACAVSVAASSLVTEHIKGKSLDAAKALTKDDVLAMLGVELTTSRVKCATLVLNALQEAINKYEIEHPVKKSPTKKKSGDSSKEAKSVYLTKDSNIAEAVMKYPVIAEVLLDYGLHCVGCFANAFDTIETGAKIHGFTSEEIDEMLIRLNEVIEFGE